MADKNTYAKGLRYHDTDDGCVRLLVVDRQPSVRRGLKMRLGLKVDLEVVGEAGDATEAIPLTRALPPDVILMDVEMPGRTALTGVLRAAAPNSAVVVLTLRDAATREQAREAGVAAFVAKRHTEGILLAAIRGVALANAKWRLHERAPASG